MNPLPASHSPRVLMISGQYPPERGGIGDYTRCLANALVDINQAVLLVVPEGSDLSDTKAPLAGVVSHWGWSALNAVVRLLGQTQADWLHIQYQTNIYNSHPAICLLPAFLRMRGWPGGVAVTFHDLQKPYLFPKAGRIRDLLLTQLAHSATVAIAADSGDVLNLQNMRAHVKQILIGSAIPADDRIEPEKLKSFRETYQIPADALLIGHFGTAGGLDTLVNAFAQIAEGVLLLIGKRKPSGPQDRVHVMQAVPDATISLIEKRGVSDRVRWTGYLPASDVALALAASDVLALPYPTGASLRRSGMIAVLAQGAAVITTTPRHPMPGLIDGLHLLTVPPGDAAALAQAIMQVASTPDLRKRLQENARRVAQTTFSWSTIARSHATIYLANARK
jgi:glycosyltransferase involved in cell wall biosynthesis